MAVKIGDKFVGEGHPCFVVAEIGINHNGSVEVAKQLIDVAEQYGANAVKFQKRTVEVVYTPEELAKPRKVDSSIIKNAFDRMVVGGVNFQVLPEDSIERLRRESGNTTNSDLKYALEFNMKDYDTIDSYCREKDIVWFASSWDGLSAHFINGYNVPCHKIASACLTHADLLKRVRYNNRPVILSTGGSTMEQIEKAVNILGRDNLIILYCVANYPCKDYEINLLVIETLKRKFAGVPIGYSGHETGILPSVAAVAMGACLVERHVTLDKNMPGSDHKASLEPQEFGQMVNEIRRFETIRGDGIKRVLPSEIPTMAKLRRIIDF
ncbi:MAG: N-acetylneuraminate synthase family protein [Candidatus Azambacteria bacterium]|nr:N-acetylneuraminate synthase family protein [Candidatus Azambacteria bacterium]